jgi:hypothetical protein
MITHHDVDQLRIQTPLRPQSSAAAAPYKPTDATTLYMFDPLLTQHQQANTVQPSTTHSDSVKLDQLIGLVPFVK